MDATTNTVFGSRVLPVKLKDGSESSITVYEIPVEDWPKAMLVATDELKLNALACRVPDLKNLSPASYNEVHRVVREVNKDGFFTYADRQAELAAESLKFLPPEMVEKLISQRLSSTLPPRAG